MCRDPPIWVIVQCNVVSSTKASTECDWGEAAGGLGIDNPCVNAGNVLWGAQPTQQQQMVVVWSCGITGLRCVPQSRRLIPPLNTHGRRGSEGENSRRDLPLSESSQCARVKHWPLIQASFVWSASHVKSTWEQCVCIFIYLLWMSNMVIISAE